MKDSKRTRRSNRNAKTSHSMCPKCGSKKVQSSFDVNIGVIKAIRNCLKCGNKWNV